MDCSNYRPALARRLYLYQQGMVFGGGGEKENIRNFQLDMIGLLRPYGKA